MRVVWFGVAFSKASAQGSFGGVRGSGFSPTEELGMVLRSDGTAGTGADLGFFGLLAGAECVGGAAFPPPLYSGARLTLTATLVSMHSSGYSPLQRESTFFKAFSISTSVQAYTSFVLARVRVEARRRDEGRSGAEIDIGDPNEEEEVEVVEIVDLRTSECRFEVRVDELGVEGECLLCSDRWRVRDGRR